ncbi:unnamed protein product [Prorocentrum cordatum]|uniref:SH3 domain-containing protein n=1 Tax=Prorocentrum cordatum TaxID=2364126 RepID=A0ABN9PID9_9DINO|nr:unnamed protein product [Polarella glacialis]
MERHGRRRGRTRGLRGVGGLVPGARARRGRPRGQPAAWSGAPPRRRPVEQLAPWRRGGYQQLGTRRLRQWRQPSWRLDPGQERKLLELLGQLGPRQRKTDRLLGVWQRRPLGRGRDGAAHGGLAQLQRGPARGGRAALARSWRLSRPRAGQRSLRVPAGRVGRRRPRVEVLADSVRGNFCIVRRPEPPTYARFSLVVRDGKVWWGSLCKFVLEWQGDVAAWLALPGNRVSFRWLRGKGYHASPRPADQWRKAVMASSWRSWDEAPAYWAAPRAPGQTYSAFSLEEEVAEEDTDEIDKTVDPFELPDKVWHSPPDDEANVNTSLSTSWIIWDEPATASASSPGTHASEAELETAARAIWGQLQSASVSLARPALHGQEPRALQPQGAPHDFGLVVKSFDPTEYGQDYMRLNEGDIVRFIREDDGWYLGERVDKETLSIKLAEGWFPPAFTHFD